ncbi:MAG: polysaccharide deacetylase family protein [Solobacterium sp.]|jgi:peptidoglycan/xylan/chitin deacetylase (PgdA/CDA1 family)/uncharacterized protein YxjI|nr:polysaccharide deacetylase family protein [Solobacterium sp.]MCH4206452.1 polysaccharide deacetylase family protein [Solobacterium sp.]MCH4227958.1 polysaccharide deacetylase family protein [Solobacterium sp.]MCH4283400.1 polysaccharide deacetylase family protein [Solobacterium sp.]
MEQHHIDQAKKQIRIKRILIIILSAVSALLLFVFFINRFQIRITLDGDSPSTVNYKDAYEDPGASAVFEGTLLPFYHKDIEVSCSGTVDTDTEGEYTLTYTAQEGHHTAQAERTVIVKDIKGPEITLITAADSYTPYNHEYQEEGYAAIDQKDGDVTANVKREVKGDKVIYTVSDAAGNTSVKERTIVYDDRKAPEITLSGGNEVTIYLGNVWTDEYSAIDDSDDDVTAKVTIEGSVDTDTIGDYTLTYTVSDTHDHTAQAQRIVHVTQPPVNVQYGTADAKAIYLTFDDGPGEATAHLLDVLDRYGVKATFFTTSCYAGYTDLIGEEARRGHTVAVHTYTHDYASVYSSTDAYWADFNAQNAVIQQQTGSASSLLRFPGGSSNTISANYSSGIMTALVQQANANGIYYYDWNVSSGDAGGTADTNTIIANVENQVSANSSYGTASIVLQHDYKAFTVEAVDDIIEWGLANGYHFEQLSPGSFTVHHHISN